MPRQPSSNDAARKAARVGKGTLKQQQISACTQTRYSAMVNYFFWLKPLLSLRWPLDWRVRDVSVCGFLEAMWGEGETKARAADLISGLQWHYEVRHVMPGAWRKYQTWNNAEPSEQTPPMPVEALLALAGHASLCGDHFFAVTIFVGFHAFLRTGEMLDLQMSQIRGDGSFFTLVLTDTKTTKRHHTTEYILLEDEGVLSCVRWARRQKQFGRLCGASPSQFRKKWRCYVSALHLDPDVFAPYSVRRGGATYDYMQSGSLDRALLRGRWQSLKAARLYVRQGEELLAKTAFSAQQHAHFGALALVFRTFIQRIST